MWKLVRTVVSDDKKAVTGMLYLNEGFVCYTLERVGKMIPAGSYRLEVSVSPSFTKKRNKKTYLPLLYNNDVPASRGIRIHCGNTYKDSTGCVLVGMDSKPMAGTLIDSMKAEEMVTYLMNNNNGYLAIFDGAISLPSLNK